MVPDKGERKEDSSELTASEKFAIKQGSNLTAKIAGDAITARGVYTLANPGAAITTVVAGRYVARKTISANERRLSESKRQADLRTGKERHVKLKVKGSPGKGKVYRSTTSYVRASRTARGRIRVSPKGRDFLHSIETTPEREKRLARSRNYSKATIIGGRALRYGVPTLMVAWTINDIIAGKSPTEIAMETVFMDDLEPLPEGEKKGYSPYKVLPIVMHLNLNPLEWF